MGCTSERYQKILAGLIIIMMMLWPSNLVWANDGHDQQQKYQWTLTDIFASDKAYEQAYHETLVQIKQLKNYQGQMSDPKAVVEFVNQTNQVYLAVEDLVAYGSLYNGLDVSNPVGITYLNQAQQIWGQYSNSVAFFIPELIALPEATKQKYLKDPVLGQLMAEIIDKENQYLSESVSILLNQLSQSLDFSSTYNILTMSELQPKPLLIEEGVTIDFTYESMVKALNSNKRSVIQSAIDNQYVAYSMHQNSLADLYQKHVRYYATLANLYGYPTSRDMALDQYEVDLGVYQQLVSSVNAHLDDRQLNYEILRRALGVEKLDYVDLKMSITSLPKTTYTMEEAKQEILASLAPMGQDYVAVAAKAFAENWIDAFPAPGKTSGAFAADVRVHPYILTNFTGDVGSIATLAHELGHAMHYYSYRQSQPAVYQGNTLLTAETASQVNEQLYWQYKVDHAKNDEEKLYALYQQINNFNAVVYTQMMYDEFEASAHHYVEQGGTLTAQYLNKLWVEVNEKYSCQMVEQSPYMAIGWARIPHFYNDFYVFNYSLSYMVATYVVNGLTNGQVSQSDYLAFLSAGNSQPALTLVNELGINLADPKVYDDVFKQYQAWNQQMMVMLAKQGRLMQEDGQIQLVVDGQVVATDTPPIIIDGHIMADVVGLGQALGAVVQLDNQWVQIQKDANDIKLALLKKQAKNHGRKIDPICKPFTVDGHILVSVRLLAEQLGYNIAYYPTTKNVVLNSKY